MWISHSAPEGVSPSKILDLPPWGSTFLGKNWGTLLKKASLRGAYVMAAGSLVLSVRVVRGASIYHSHCRPPGLLTLTIPFLSVLHHSASFPFLQTPLCSCYTSAYWERIWHSGSFLKCLLLFPDKKPQSLPLLLKAFASTAFCSVSSCCPAPVGTHFCASLHKGFGHSVHKGFIEEKGHWLAGM